MELVSVAKSAGQSLASAQRESCDGAMVGILIDIVIALHERNDFFENLSRDKVGVHGVVWLVQAAGVHLDVRVGVWHHDNHPFGEALCDEIVKNDVGVSHLEPCLVGVRHAVDKVENRKFFLSFRFISRRGIYAHRPFDAAAVVGMVVAVAYFSVRDVLHILDARLRTAYVGKAVFESFIREDEHVGRIGYLGAVNHEGIRVDVRNFRLHGDAPCPVGVLGHRSGTAEHLALEFHLGCVRCVDPERYAAVGIVLR